MPLAKALAPLGVPSLCAFYVVVRGRYTSTQDLRSQSRLAFYDDVVLLCQNSVGFLPLEASALSYLDRYEVGNLAVTGVDKGQ